MFVIERSRSRSARSAPRTSIKRINSTVHASAVIVHLTPSLFGLVQSALSVSRQASATSPETPCPVSALYSPVAVRVLRAPAAARWVESRLHRAGVPARRRAPNPRQMCDAGVHPFLPPLERTSTSTLFVCSISSIKSGQVELGDVPNRITPACVGLL